jgi:periplasmic protein TonB
VQEIRPCGAIRIVRDGLNLDGALSRTKFESRTRREEFTRDMIRLDPSSAQPIGPELSLWGGCFFLVVALHVVAVVGLKADRSEGQNAGDPTVIIELDADSTAPLQGQSELTPGPEQVQTDRISQASVAQQQVIEHTQKEEETTPPKIDLPNTPDPEVALPQARETLEVKPDEEKLKEKDTEKRQQTPSEAHVESAPTAAPQAETIVAPHVTIAGGAAVEDTADIITWRERLAAHVQRFKRYPAEALAKRLHGNAMVRFTIDRAGAVISAEIVGHSGTEVLDRESLSLIARAAPLPQAPHHVRGTHFTFTVPVHFLPQH